MGTRKGQQYKRSGKSHKRNPSGVAGVRLGSQRLADGSKYLWRAFIFLEGRDYCIGSSRDFDTAVSMRQSAWEAYQLRGEKPKPNAKCKRNKEP